MPRYPENPIPVPRHPSEPFLIRGDDPYGEGYLIHPPATTPYSHQPAPYAPQPGAHLASGTHGQPAYYYPHPPAPAPTTASPLLKNAALATGILIGIGGALWLAASFITAIAALLQSLAIVVTVLVGGALALKLLVGSGKAHVDVCARGRSRVAVNTRRGARVRRR